jgi:hypothetical protein
LILLLLRHSAALLRHNDRAKCHQYNRHYDEKTPSILHLNSS